MAPPTSTRPESPEGPSETGRPSLDQSLSDSERPVREKLKQTSIAGLPEGYVSGDNKDSSLNESSDEARGRPKKKRSLEELEDAEDPSDSRKRSRDVSTAASTSKKASGDGSVAEFEENGFAKKADAIGSDGSSAAARPLTPEATEIDMDSDEKTGLQSPKNKRDRATYLRDEAHEAEPKITGNGKVEEPSAKRTKDDEKAGQAEKSGAESASAADAAVSKIPPGSGFANTSAVSPFGALAGAKSASNTPPPTSQPQTSAAAFQTSGFGKLSGSSASPFGALSGSSAASPFGALSGSKPSSSFGSPPPTTAPASTSSAFGGALGKPLSSFAATSSTPSAFGGLGSSSGGFGGLGSLGGSKLSSFASSSLGSAPPPIIGLSNKPAKPFGAPADEEDEEEGTGAEDEGAEDTESGIKSPESTDGGKDRRFYQQHIDTGEEGEETIFHARAKLYNFVTIGNKQEWKERGLGVFKLNVTKASKDDEETSEADADSSTEDKDEEDEEDKDDDAGKKQARFVMRADGSHRVILNSRVNKELKVGDPQGAAPKGSYFFFFGSLEGGGLELLQVKMRNPLPQELYTKVKELQEEM